MGFEALLGNERLRNNLSKSLSRGHISHFYLISGPKGSGKRTLAKLLAAAILCREGGKPCGACLPCRKVMNNSHPDFITVDDPEKKTVSVELIRQARADIYIQPNESDHKIYLFPRAQDMQGPAQNALLKVLEEPPSYGVFILLTDNPEKLLPTVRSRCTELALQPLSEGLLRQTLAKDFPEADGDTIAAAIARSGGYLGQARDLLEQGGTTSPETEAFVKAYASRSALELTRVLAPMEKWKRDQVMDVLQQWLAILTDALTCRSGMTAATAMAKRIGASRSSQEILEATDHIRTALEYAQGNVSPGAICGWLVWKLR